jgi:hypothetical protein
MKNKSDFEITSLSLIVHFSVKLRPQRNARSRNSDEDSGARCAMRRQVVEEKLRGLPLSSAIAAILKASGNKYTY